MLFTCKMFTFLNFTCKNFFFVPRNGGGGGGIGWRSPTCPSFLYSPMIALILTFSYDENIRAAST